MGNMNDDDIMMIEFAYAADLIANGVCPICEDALDVFASKWDNDRRWNGGNALQNAASRSKWAKLVGPVAADGTHHASCLASLDDDDGWW